MAEPNGDVAPGAKPNATDPKPKPAARPGPGRPPNPARAAGRPAPGPAKPGPTIERAARPGLDTPRGNGPGIAGAIRPGGARSGPVAPSALTPPRSPARSTPKRLQELHATAARRLGLPELAISADEAAELQSSMEAVAELTGFAPSGPTWVWLGVFWTVFSIYAGRFVDIRARRAAELAHVPDSPPRPIPAAPESAPIAMGAAAIGTAILNQGTVAARPAVAQAAPASDLPDAVLEQLLNGHIAEGGTPASHAAPSTTFDERMDLQ